MVHGIVGETSCYVEETIKELLTYFYYDLSQN